MVKAVDPVWGPLKNAVIFKGGEGGTRNNYMNTNGPRIQKAGHARRIRRARAEGHGDVHSG